MILEACATFASASSFSADFLSQVLKYYIVCTTQRETFRYWSDVWGERSGAYSDGVSNCADNRKMVTLKISNLQPLCYL
ncbi:hypothetical protein ES332_D10G201400v1 [Gossypium tomentosum]|uniref:Uncharacterized protein n=1 Tax=Gossypium tomentosum TaxID=34277 RepID=A0A5D2J7Y1_GOSTO|nr:hypothetical protein ES332_D10G201400v1 [Gossypium tomentosum]